MTPLATAFLLAGVACKPGSADQASTVSPSTAGQAYEEFKPVAVEVTHNQLLYLEPSLGAPAISRYTSEQDAQKVEMGRVMVLTALGRQGEWLKVAATGCELGGPNGGRYELWVPLKGAQVEPGVEAPVCNSPRPAHDAADASIVSAGPVFSREGVELGRLVVDWAAPSATEGAGDGGRSCHATSLGFVDGEGWRPLELCVEPGG